MASSKVPHFLRANRKRLGLSQKDVAYLLGTSEGARVCRYEHFEREPSLETILALEIILQKPPSELFAGLQHRIEIKVKKRVRELLKQVEPDAKPDKRLRSLKVIIDSKENKS